jgi:tripartite-type tricarboxylate transporter receptor subunit TctC
LSQVQGGHLRALAIASPRRMAELPGVPTLKEGGTDVDGDLWTGVFAPSGTPPAIVKKLESEFIRIARLPEVIARLKPLGVQTIGNSSEEFTRILAADIIRWGAVAKAGNIKIEQ